MPPKSSKAGDAPKQKSLMTWFGKAPDNPPRKSTPKQPASNATTVPQTPESKRPDLRVLNSSAAASASSYGGSSSKDTPPTSDVIDIDMLSDQEDRRVRVTTVRLASMYLSIN